VGMMIVGVGGATGGWSNWWVGNVEDNQVERRGRQRALQKTKGKKRETMPSHRPRVSFDFS
jgi:hypothetical protein